MTEEIAIAGVYVPTFVVACAVALGLGLLLSRLAARVLPFDFRRFVWHPALFDFAIFVVLLATAYHLLGALLP